MTKLPEWLPRYQSPVQALRLIGAGRVVVEPRDLPLEYRIAEGDYETWREVGPLDMLAHRNAVLRGAGLLHKETLGELPFQREALQLLWDELRCYPDRYPYYGLVGAPVAWKVYATDENPFSYWELTGASSRERPQYLQRLRVFLQSILKLIEKVGAPSYHLVRLEHIQRWLDGPHRTSESLAEQARMIHEFADDNLNGEDFCLSLLANQFEELHADLIHALADRGVGSVTEETVSCIWGECLYEVEPTHPRLSAGEV